MRYIYSAEIKEVGNNIVLKPSHVGKEMTKQDLIDFWGLNEPDVEWFKLYKVEGLEEVDRQIEL